MQCIESTKSLTSLSSSTVLAAFLNIDFLKNSSSALENRDAQSLGQESEETIQCVWRRIELTSIEFVIYAFIVPVLAFFGLCANAINFIVFMRPKMTPSAFSYLAALSFMDCISCLLITITCFSRSFLYKSTFWLAYDFQWQTPLFGITTGAANLILACVSLDRFIYLRWGIPNGTPKFCRRIVARSTIVTVILVSILVNLPYFWVFVVEKDGTFKTTAFYFSRFFGPEIAILKVIIETLKLIKLSTFTISGERYYRIHNWFTFILLTLLPAIFLMLGNTAILIAFCKWAKQSKKCQNSCSKPNYKNSQIRYKHQMKLTVSIVIVVTLYLVGELPAHLTSRKSVVNLLYGGDVNKINFQSMQRLEVICITLNSIQLSLNIIVYAVINPCFMPEFFNCLKGASDVCFRLMGFMVVASCWRKIFNSSKEKINKNLKCADDSDRCNEQSFSDISWQVKGADEKTLNVGGNCETNTEELNINVICMSYKL